MTNLIPMSVPFLTGNEERYLLDCIRSSWISSAGAYIPMLEERVARYIGSRYAVAVSNGTVALHLALTSLEIGSEDEVIVPNLTFAATANAVLHTGATPVLVDVDPESWNLDVGKAESLVTSRTRAIVPVHLYGFPCDMQAVSAFADKHGLRVIEDAAEAFGAEYRGSRVGSLGDIGCFSFYGNKIMTTGEGGICITDDQALYDRMVQLRDHGMDRAKRYWHETVGFNYRMTNMQAAVGCAQIERIDEILAKRKKVERHYRELLASEPQIRTQVAVPGAAPVCWMYSICIEERGPIHELRSALERRNIETRPLFYPLHQMPPYREFGVDAHLGISAQLATSGLCLPAYPQMTQQDVRRVSTTLLEVVGDMKPPPPSSPVTTA